MEILNFTGKPIIVESDYGKSVEIYSSGFAQLMAPPKEKVRLVVDNIPVRLMTFGRVVNLPREDPSKEILYVVLKDVARAIGHSRNDILVMKNSSLVDEKYRNDGLFTYI